MLRSDLLYAALCPLSYAALCAMLYALCLLKVLSSPSHQHGTHMKFIILLLAIYLFYRFFLTPQKPLPPPQEPDLFIDHEEVKKENEKNK